MDERQDDVIAVTMSYNAAERFTEALTFAERTLADAVPLDSTTEGGALTRVHTAWLRWGVARVTSAEETGEPRREGSVSTDAIEAARWAMEGTLCDFNEDTGHYELIQGEEEDVVRGMLVAAGRAGRRVND